jgi:acyl dehydratase
VYCVPQLRRQFGGVDYRRTVMVYNVYWEDVEVGQEIKTWSRKTDFMNWNRYAAVNDEFVYIHMDDEAGRASLNEAGAFGMGNLRLAYLHNMLQEWAGDEAQVKKLGCQYRAINQKNDVLTCIGKITDKRMENGEHLVDLEVDVLNQDGKSTTPGEATVALPSRQNASS